MSAGMFDTVCELTACSFVWMKDIVFYLVIAIVVNILIARGPRRLINDVVVFVVQVPVIQTIASWYLKKELKGFIQQIGLEASGSINSQIKPLPEKGDIIIN